MDDRSWIDRRVDDFGFVTNEFKEGVQFFVRFAFSRPQAKSEIKCPCSKCRCRKWGNPEVVSMHLCKHGFMNNYYLWYVHGETANNPAINFIGESSNSGFDRNESDAMYHEMLVDAMGLQGEYNEEPMAEEPNHKAREFYELLHAAEVHIGIGEQNVTVLSWMAEMLNMKTLYNMSAANWEMALSLSRKLLSAEDQEKVPKDFYSAKKMMNVLGLGYKKIDVCINDCFLYYGEQNKNLNACPVCGESRYEPRNMAAVRQKAVPRKSLWYLSITPRLQRLYMSRKTAEHMTWHLKCRDDSDEVIHPAGSEAWKHFDKTYPTFAEEPRNVRLGLCTDGFNPFGSSGSTYSCWPVFLTVYNLPPELCMNSEHIFLSMIIAGPKSPGKNIDVLLRPLIDELNELWTNGVETYDSFRKQNFIMKAALLWTVSDFPGYGMLSGWSTHGRLSCPYCMENTKAFQLQFGRKISFFDCHRQYLPPTHPFRRDKKNFYVNRIERSPPPPRLDGHLIEERVNQLPDIIFGQSVRKQSIPGFGVSHNWVKRSIFWELPYWKDLLIRHNLDVMHCEKNFFDNIKNTVMDDKDCTKDNTNARMDLQLYCNRPELELIPQQDGTALKPNATYVLTREQRALVCQWLKDLRFPDGYASNIARCVKMHDFRLSGMKSHDCHVFMQRLLPIAFRDNLIDAVWGPLTDVSNFFRALCTPIIRVSNMEMWEEKIVETICKLEKVFPPAFFDSMEHLAIHLPYEAKVGGPVQCRWMYPFERKMHDLKKKVLNKNRVEASICEAYILSEISFFCSHYFGSDIETRLNRLPRNIVIRNDNIDGYLSVFQNRGQPLGGEMRGRALSPRELKAVELYVLLNCEEVKPWIALFDSQICCGLSPDQTDMKRQLEFIPWFKTTVRSGIYEVDPRLLTLVTGPVNNVRLYNGYWVNGFRFHTISYGKNKKTMNSGVCVRGTTLNDDELEYYGQLKEVIELHYFDAPVPQSVILFNCDWYDLNKGIVIHPSSRIVDVNPRFKLQTNEPFILASQAQQVFYASYPSRNPRRRGWYAACKIRARAIIDTSSLRDCVNDYYQDDDPPMPQLVQPSTIVDDDVSLASLGGERVVIGEEMQLSYVAEQNEEECVDEDDEEEDEFEGTETPEEEVPDYLTESDSD
ncbi:hypothetical protein SLA2020_157120 [Shorea laevis]